VAARPYLAALEPAMPEIVPAELFLTGPDGESGSIRIVSSPFVIGRTESAHLARPSDTMLSRQHCAIEWNGDGWHVRDLNSKNGTTLNGQPLTKETRLNPGDRIVAGRQILEFERSLPSAPPRRSGPLEFVEDAAAPLRPDSTFIISLDAAKISAKPAGAQKQELDRANKRMEALVRAGRELASFRPLEELFNVTLDLALESVGAKRGVLMTIEGGELIVKAHRGEGFKVPPFATR
jgi:pSer/pThr/pTyr-binding forkhead associated (FHA) protein